MKKILAILLIAVLAVSLSACGESKPPKENTTTAAPAETTTEKAEETTTAPEADEQAVEPGSEAEPQDDATEDAAAADDTAGTDDADAAENTAGTDDADAAEDANTGEAGSLELTTINGTVWTLSYPASFTFEEDASYQGGLGQKNEKKRGILQGDFQIGICDGEVYTNVYENVEALNAQFKKSTIYEERDIDGATAYISQKGEYAMKVIIAYADTYYICLNVISEGGDYQAIYEGDAFNEILGSIAFSGGQEQSSITSDNGYLVVTPVGAWYEGERKASNAVTLYNDSIGPVSWIMFYDNQVTTPDKLKEYILAGFANYSFEPMTIGNNDYEVLDANSVSYLVAPTSTGKGIQIELRNVTLDQARELLETIEIK